MDGLWVLGPRRDRISRCKGLGVGAAAAAVAAVPGAQMVVVLHSHRSQSRKTRTLRSWSPQSVTPKEVAAPSKTGKNKEQGGPTMTVRDGLVNSYSAYCTLYVPYCMYSAAYSSETTMTWTLPSEPSSSSKKTAWGVVTCSQRHFIYVCTLCMYVNLFSDVRVMCPFCHTLLTVCTYLLYNLHSTLV